ncbi:Glycine betaine transport ATP-binding protein OpuAA (plasmid) [Paracoccaceae bacterium]|nr:Glycine betaine transport ATP-binding protein OpuAA [Paracoccaceae bacterium]
MIMQAPWKIADRIAIMKDGQVVQIGTLTDLVLNPADDYVAEFTADVPVTRVLSAAHVMEAGHAESAPSVAAGTSLEDVLSRFNLAAGPVNVDGRRGPLGRITATGLAAALHGGRPGQGVGQDITRGARA